MVPPGAMLIPFFVLYQTVGLQGTHIGPFIAHVAQNFAIIIWVMKGVLGVLSAALEAAGMVDGGGHWRVFRSIMLPWAMPRIAATGVLSFLFF